HHGIEPRNTGCWLAHRDQRLTMRERAERAKVGIAAPDTDLGGADSHIPCGLRVVAERGKRSRDENVSGRRALPTDLGAQLLRAGKPTAGWRLEAAHHETESEPEGIAGGLGVIARGRRTAPPPPSAWRSGRQHRTDRRESQP